MIKEHYSIHLSVSRPDWSYTEVTDAVTTVTQGKCHQLLFNHGMYAEVRVGLGVVTISEARQIEKKLKTLLRSQGYKVT